MSLLRNALFNFVGGIIPAVAALLTVPVIVSRLGESAYGVFALVTSIVGYFAVLDINVTAGSVKYLSEHHARKEYDRANEVLSFGGWIYLVIGVLGCAGILFFTPQLVSSVFKIPAALQPEAARALHWAAGGFLFGQMQAYLQSVPQALQRYDVSGKLEGFFGTVVSVSTLVVVLAGGGLVEIMLSRAVLSAINCVVLVNAIRRIYPQARVTRPRRSVMGKVASFSAYSYLARLASITFLNADKLLIAALKDMRALSHYTVPFLLANRVFAMVFRLGHVLFPATSAFAATGDTARLRSTYLAATRYIVFLNTSLCMVLVLFGRELLHYWAGKNFAEDATLVLILVALGVFIDSLTNLPSLVNDGLGQPRNTGLFAIARAVIGISLAYAAVSRWGILGAAASQLLVSSLMTTIFVVHIHRNVIPVTLGELFTRAYLPSFVLLVPASAAALAFVGRPVIPLLPFLGLLAASGLALAGFGWTVVLPADQRLQVQARARHMLGLA